MATPTLADRYCTSIAIRFAAMMTHTQQVAVLGAAGDVGGEVARVDVGDGGDEGRAEHGEAAADRAAGADGPQRADVRRAGTGGARVAASAVPAGGGAVMPAPPRAWRRRGGRRARASRRSTLDEQRAAERLLVDDPQRVPGHDLARGEVAQHLRVGVARCARTSPARPARASRGAAVARLGEDEVGGRDRVAVRVVRRVAELGGDQLLELLGEDVLERLGLVVHAIPRHAERLAPGRARAAGGGGCISSASRVPVVGQLHPR